MHLNEEEERMLFSVIEKTGGIEKWYELHGRVQALVHSRNLPMIVNFARGACRTDGGARQIVLLMLLGLGLSRRYIEALDKEAECDQSGHQH